MMWRFPTALALVVVLSAGTLGCAGDPFRPSDAENIENLMRYFQVPGAGVAVIKNFEIAYLEYYGVKSKSTLDPITDKTLYQAASMSKGVAAAAALSLVRDGIVSLDTEVNDYLTSWELPWNAYQEREPVNLRRLLSHTAGTSVSGFRGYRYSEPLPTLIQILNGEYPANSAPIVVDVLPGSRFRYSGGGYLVMQQALMDVTGKSFPDIVRDQILVPMDMASSTYEQPLPDSLRAAVASGNYANGVPVPGGHHIYPEIAAGGLWTTPTDVARFLIEMQLSLAGRTGGVLNRDEAELLLTEVRRGYGLGFDLLSHGGQPYFGHQGANDGFRGGMIAHRSSGDGLVLLTNSDRGSELYDAVVKLIGRREGWPGF